MEFRYILVLPLLQLHLQLALLKYVSHYSDDLILRLMYSTTVLQYLVLLQKLF